MAFSNDGLKMFIVGWYDEDINEYTLSTPFDVSTATFDDVVFSVSMQETAPTGMAFSNDGAKMFVIGDQGKAINEYTLSSVYPITVTSPPAGGAFVTTWRTTTADESITLPISGSDMTVDWGDGNTATGVSAPVDHTYNTAGDYTIQVTGGLERFHLNNAADASKLVSLDQWGNTTWTTMENAFYGADNMAYNAADSPDLSTVTDMSGMFRGADSFNGDLSNWNVSKVTDMNRMFSGADAFDGDISSWSVSKVTDMESCSAAPPTSTSPSTLGTSPLSPTCPTCSGSPPPSTSPSTLGTSPLSPTCPTCSITPPPLTIPSTLGTSRP